MSIKTLIISGAAVLALTMGASIADAKKAPKAPKDPATVAAKSEKSKSCSAQATEKQLHARPARHSVKPA